MKQTNTQKGRVLFYAILVIILIIFVVGGTVLKTSKKNEQKSLWKSFRQSKVWEYFQVITVAFILVFGFIRPFVVEAFKIPSGSMEDTLLVGDRILVCKFIYGIKIPFTDYKILDFNKPSKGDVFVFIPPHEKKRSFIKRIVATEGDTVETRGSRLYVNGKLVNDSAYVEHNPARPLPNFPPFRPNYKQRQHFPSGQKFDNFMLPYSQFYSKYPNGHPFKVPKGYVFAMGDNRDESSDSRRWGPVQVDKIKGQAFLIYWSYDPNAGKWWQFYKKIRIGRIGQIIKPQFDKTKT